MCNGMGKVCLNINVQTHINISGEDASVKQGKEKKYIEDINFFEVNTKHISSSELKTSKFSRVRSTSENLDVFKSRDEIYLVFTDKK